MAAAEFAASRSGISSRDVLPIADRFYEWLKEKEPKTNPLPPGPV